MRGNCYAVDGNEKNILNLYSIYLGYVEDMA